MGDEGEGGELLFLVNPREVEGDESGRVKRRKLQKMRLGEKGSDGRARPEPIEGDDFFLEVDSVIAAVGQGIDPSGMTGFELTKGNTIVAD